MTITDNITSINWTSVASAMHHSGYALLPNMLHADQCRDLISSYDQAGLYRKTIVMERYRFGAGEYKYFTYPLPDVIQQIRTAVYPPLAVIANDWFSRLNIKHTFPERHDELLQQCRDNGQRQCTVLILKYNNGGHNTLHQDLYGETFFPMQLVLFLSEPDIDYTGGEFVLTQQVPRAQSRVVVLKPRRGDGLIFTTNFRPVKSTRGYYRATMKHGVSDVHEGERYTLGIPFHDAMR